jgi:hypothetical protein
MSVTTIEGLVFITVRRHLPGITAVTMLLATLGAFPGVPFSQQVPLVELVGLLYAQAIQGAGPL